RRLLPRLAVLAAATFIVSGAWMLAVDTWPADSRPYIGGSKDNTVQDLVLGYNGFGRVDGEENGPSARRQAAGAVPGGPAAGNAGQQARPGGAQPFARPGGPGAGTRGRGPGGIIAGAPDLLRMFDSANGGQIAWFLPLALGGAVAGLWR